ncbi:MAG: energy-coupling factor ABC transporter permease, partial [Candidatus Abyssubacteria bacterium]|nr:energy-coupling factor ABC transporter permease [Candidatus Abyssubacteria bacterium]
MALPAVVCYLLLGRFIRSPRAFVSGGAAFTCGFAAVLISAVMLAASLVFTEESFLTVAKIAFAAHLPVMVIEGLLTAFIVGFFRRVKPEILEGSYAGSTRSEE